MEPTVGNGSKPDTSTIFVTTGTMLRRALNGDSSQLMMLTQKFTFCRKSVETNHALFSDFHGVTRMAFGKRIDGPGGRRKSPRAPVLLSVAMHTVGASRTASLLDVSATGAKLRVQLPLRVRDQVWLSLPPHDLFGKVMWIDGDECGVTFDTPITEEQAGNLQGRGRVVRMPRLSLEEQLAVEDWKVGLVR
jgi:hypothetical protein